MDRPEDLKTTPLHTLHVELGAKMVPFAGYDMPVQYPVGILKEHEHTRTAAGLFDVSHMGQAEILGPDHEAVARAFEALVPGNIVDLKPGAMRYTLLLNGEGGILDDMMVTRLDGLPGMGAEGRFMIVANASRKEADFAHIADGLPEGIRLEVHPERALLALQGPKAEAVLARHGEGVPAMTFMTAAPVKVAGADCLVSRSGYTGEDGFEISVPAKDAERLARALLAEPECEAIGLGARDSLRLEAGLCLYGNDIDETTTPVEADLNWAVAKRRREEKSFPGAHRVLPQLSCGAGRKRVGLVVQGRAPARAGTEIADGEGNIIGMVTSGTFGPSFGGPVAMGYVKPDFAAIGTDVGLIIRGRTHKAKVAPMPFVPHRYRRG